MSDLALTSMGMLTMVVRLLKCIQIYVELQRLLSDLFKLLLYIVHAKV